MTLDIRARATADKLIGKFGKPITLTRIVEGAYNPATGEMAANTVTTESVFALIKDYNGYELMSGMVQAGDKKVKVASMNTNEPQIGDTVTVDSLVYSVLAVKSIWSGAMSAMYELQVRK